MMNRQLAIIGAGGHGKVVADTAEEMGLWEKIVFIDDVNKDSHLLIWPILGDTKIIGSVITPDKYDIAIAIGNNPIRKNFFNRLNQLDFSLPKIIHPSACISKHSCIGWGSVVFAQSVINAGTMVGDCAIINTAASVDHDCLIGDFVHVSPGAHLAGETIVGDLSWIGIGACSKQSSKIGSNCIIGAGSVIIQDIQDNVIAFGAPAKPFTKIEKC